VIESPPDIMHHIIGEELNKGLAISTSAEKILAKETHQNWKMGFTVSKSINSKKLIENIARETKLFPYLKGGLLKFNAMRDTYAEGDEDVIINDDDVISLKFNRTKIDDIRTKVVLHYHKDYAADEYLHTTESLNIYQTAFDMFEDAENPESGYSNEYYGIPTDRQVGDDVIEVDYIRHQGEGVHYDETIAKLHQFLLAWYCNQHNTCQVKLGLKFLNIEPGDIAVFPTLINRRKAYGEDYSLGYLQGGSTVIRNGQQILPFWMITSTTKSLTNITLELIQMHNLEQ